jgi:hypothetical protein
VEDAVVPLDTPDETIDLFEMLPEQLDGIMDSVEIVAPSDIIDEAEFSELSPEEIAKEVQPEEILIVYFTEPADGLVAEEGTAVVFEAFVEDTLYPTEELTATFTSDLDGELWSDSLEGSNYFGFTTNGLNLGQHKITLTVTSPSGEMKEVDIKVGICTIGKPETFDTPLSGTTWKTYGDAFWDPDGYLDMTGNSGDKQGAIFNVAQKINPGDVMISFKIQTGPNVGTGADGFAMTVYDAADVDELESLIAAAHGGGGLGYGVSGPYGPAVIDALHVEIDTWHNVFNGTVELHTDPTSENHVAVCMNGNPGDCPLWLAVPNIEDLAWHDIAIKIEGYHITVSLDGSVVIDEDVPEFEFRGGYIGFTGSTGYYSNFHRFDDLLVVQACIVP